VASVTFDFIDAQTMTKAASIKSNVTLATGRTLDKQSAA
jgi:hypothetical protein